MNQNPDPKQKKPRGRPRSVTRNDISLTLPVNQEWLDQIDQVTEGSRVAWIRNTCLRAAQRQLKRGTM